MGTVVAQDRPRSRVIWLWSSMGTGQARVAPIAIAMRLLLDALRVLLKSALRFAGLVLALFALHLLLTRALPEVRRAAVLLDSKPQLAEQLRSFSVDLDRERRGAEELERRLNEAKRRHLDELGGSIASWQQRLDELAARKRAVEQQLGELSRERDEY